MSRKVNVGCGEFRLSGFENIDITRVPAAVGCGDVILADALSYDYSGADGIYAGHFIEHLTLEDARKFLRRVHEHAPGGAVLAVTVPDFDRESFMEPDVRYSSIHGGHRWPGDEHRSRWTAAELIREISEAGWSEVREWSACPWIGVQVPWQVCVRGEKRVGDAR